MLRLEGIKWNAEDGTEILKGIDMEIPDGKLVVITGPNGSGKTTLAKLIAGLVTPSEGHIYLENQDITELDMTQRARMGMAYAFQQPVRFKGITVRQLMQIAAGGELTYSELCDYLSMVGLCAREYVDREVNATLSGGEIKRIEIATVLARKAKLSVFDEPEAGIDLWSFTNLIEAFQNMRKNLQGSLIIISHQERILKIADEIVIVADGKVQAKGPAEEMMNQVVLANSMSKSCVKQEG